MARVQDDSNSHEDTTIILISRLLSISYIWMASQYCKLSI
jgi:hypothetical protein